MMIELVEPGIADAETRGQSTRGLLLLNHCYFLPGLRKPVSGHQSQSAATQRGVAHRLRCHKHPSFASEYMLVICMYFDQGIVTCISRPINTTCINVMDRHGKGGAIMVLKNYSGYPGTS